MPSRDWTIHFLVNKQLHPTSNLSTISPFFVWNWTRTAKFTNLIWLHPRRLILNSKQSSTRFLKVVPRMPMKSSKKEINYQFVKEFPNFLTLVAPSWNFPNWLVMNSMVRKKFLLVVLSLVLVWFTTNSALLLLTILQSKVVLITPLLLRSTLELKKLLNKTISPVST